MKRSATLALAATFAVLQPTAARAEVAVPKDNKVAVGVKLGVIPPIFAVPEVVVRPVPHLVLGVFGIATSGGLGQGGARTNLGGEVMAEFREGRQGTGYLSLAYDYYHADPTADGFYETSSSLYFTAGGVKKLPHLDLFFGGGLAFRVIDEKPPCGEQGFCVQIGPDLPVLPVLELGGRFAFL